MIAASSVAARACADELATQTGGLLASPLTRRPGARRHRPQAEPQTDHSCGSGWPSWAGV